MIDKYIDDLDACICASPFVVFVEVVRRDIRDTGFEKIALYRYRLELTDGSMIEIMERITEERDKIETTKYRYHWQDSSGKLIKRWDNAPHHPEVDTYPHHIHDGSEENVMGYEPVSAVEVLGIVFEKF